MKKIIVIGSNSIHTVRYIDNIIHYFDDLMFISNKSHSDSRFSTFFIPFSFGVGSFLSIFKLRKLIRKFDPSVIHVHQANVYSFFTVIATIGLSIPVVITTWGSDVLINPKKNYILKWMLVWVLKNARVVTSDSLYMSQKIISYHKGTKVINVNFGVSSNYELAQKKEKIIFSNRNHEKLYNIDKIIISFSFFVKNNNDWKLIIAGSGSQTDNLKQLVVELGITESVDFVGWLTQKDNLSYYQRSSLFVSVPHSDATSISLLEAVSNNCICFVSNLPANTEHILDRVNGVIVTDVNKIEFDGYKNININLLHDVNTVRRQFYTVEYNVNKFFQIYDSII